MKACGTVRSSSANVKVRSTEPLLAAVELHTRTGQLHRAAPRCGCVSLCEREAGPRLIRACTFSQAALSQKGDAYLSTSK